MIGAESSALKPFLSDSDVDAVKAVGELPALRRREDAGLEADDDPPGEVRLAGEVAGRGYGLLAVVEAVHRQRLRLHRLYAR